MGGGGRREKGSFISLPHPYPQSRELAHRIHYCMLFALDIKSPVSPSKCSTDVRLRYTFPFFGKWNWFVQMLNAISAQNLPVLNFAYHLPKQWTNRYSNVDGKQPQFFFYLSYTVLYFYKNKSSSRILSSISLFQACRRAQLSERLFVVLPLFFFVVNFSPAFYYPNACNRLFIHKNCFSRFYQLIFYFKKFSTWICRFSALCRKPDSKSLCCRLPPQMSQANNRAREITQYKQFCWWRTIYK